MSDDKNEKRMDRMEGNIAVLQADVASCEENDTEIKDILKQMLSLIRRIDYKLTVKSTDYPINGKLIN